MSDDKYTMSITLNVLNHLGINLYSNIPSVLSEVVANAWDADASIVNISFDPEEKTITIIDNGCGMSIDDINNHYLSVGYAKRDNNNGVSPMYGRKYMGRKGIGKLSMFSIARKIDVITRKNGELSSFRMNVDDITHAISRKDGGEYHPIDLDIQEDLSIPNEGTKIVLRDLKRNISSASPDYLRKRIARRFSIIGDEYSFDVYVNGQKVTIDDRDYSFPVWMKEE